MKRMLAVLALAGCAGASHGSSLPAVFTRTPAHTAGALHRAGTVNPIQHVVIIVQENRSFDNLFNGFPGADTVRTGVDSQGNEVPLHPTGLGVTYDLNHSHHYFEIEYDKGAMNGFDLEQVHPGAKETPPPDTAYGYVRESKVDPYWTMAEHYALADRMFQTNAGPSFPAHQYLLSGTSAIDTTGKLYAMDNPNEVYLSNVGGCDDPPKVTVNLINPATNYQPKKAGSTCFDHPVLMDLLDQAGITWRYYQTHMGPGLWNGPDAVRHIRYGPDYANVVTPDTQILTDIQNNALPGVSWVIPTGAESDHAGVCNDSGPRWVAQVVNAIGESPYWDSTAIFVVWDDWGGWYDHVAPQQFNYYELGFRVPLIAISPWSKHWYVSHVQHEFGSILKFTEETFGLPSLGYTDARADDLSDMFNFKQTLKPFQPIPAASPAPADRADLRDPDDD
ncbi:MAG TPA: alkaline phosphatase family protein [Candidatus Baltobacteraceae bacterium]|jgi:phospholipase C|nr:alkaline phosphatase family protein [Candidatus Baltobacteraceae bacterium]